MVPFQTPSLYLFILLNCCKCIVFTIWINHAKPECSLNYSHRHLMHLLALLGPFFTKRNYTFPYPFIFFNRWNPNLLKYLAIPESWKWHPFRMEPPRIGHFREHPRNSSRLSISLHQQCPYYIISRTIYFAHLLMTHLSDAILLNWIKTKKTRHPLTCTFCLYFPL